MEPKPRLIAPTPNQVSSSSTPIDPSRFNRTYQFFPPLQSRDTSQPIINNWMMPIFSLHAPTPQHIHPSASLNNQNHMYMVPISNSNNHVTFSPSSSTSSHFSDAITPRISPYPGNSPNPSSNLNSPPSSSTVSRNRHKCDWPGCTWSFKRLEHLKRHMITHTGERKYTCHYPGCGKKFGRSDNFAAHYKTHTKSNPRRSRKSTNVLNNSTDISALDIALPQDNPTLTNGISGIMTIQLPPPPPPPAVPSSSLTQDQIDAFHYYCDTTSASNTNSRSSISDNSSTSADHTLRYRECY
ncbi:3346_t:CDS:2 [Cetraspora pellucida]|uniref:3346_t:CDS:1 n=1 Tax=Cetraspora pellucida TaxID=1433469 RepID=A0A9N9GJ65_9GLOM|nr:3346_t:CDS:2 [Cetraspora pellucida]